MKLYKLFLLIPALILPLSLSGCDQGAETETPEATEEFGEEEAVGEGEVVEEEPVEGELE